jgi:hypothetical protein
MDILDQPTNLHFKNGKVFPPNVVFMGYIVVGAAVAVFFLGNIFIGFGVLLLSLFLSLTNYGVEIHPETFTISEYTSYLGFIKIKKKIDSRKYAIITVVPSKQSNTMYARTNTSTNYTDYYHSVCLLTKQYRGKRELTKFTQKAQAVEVAKELGHRMNLEYFEYDPRVIRDKMLGR